jgi:hypothetical protein
MKNVGVQALCPLCGLSGEVWNGLTRKGPWNYVQCGCGAVFLSPVPTDEALRKYYNETYMVPAEAHSRGVAENAPEMRRRF